MTDTHVHVGRVSRAQGLKGQLKLSTFDHDAPSIRPGVALLLVPPPSGTVRPSMTCCVQEVRPASDGIVVRVDGVADRSSAEALRGWDVHVALADLPPLGEGEHWAFELVGCAVVDPDGNPLGEVVAINDGPAHALLVVRTPAGSEREIPVVTELVPAVDTVARRITVRPIPGLIDDDTYPPATQRPSR